MSGSEHLGWWRVLRRDLGRPRLFPLVAALGTAGGILAWALLVFYPRVAEVLPDDPVAAASYGPEAFAAWQLKFLPADRPALVVLGGSSMIEALDWPPRLAETLSARLGRDISVVNLSTSGQTLAESYFMLLNTPLPRNSVVVVHVNMGRFWGRVRDLNRYLRDARLPFLDREPLAGLFPNRSMEISLEQKVKELSSWAMMIARHKFLAHVKPAVADAIRDLFRRRACPESCREALFGGTWLRPLTPETALYEYDRRPMTVTAKAALINSLAKPHAERFRKYMEGSIELVEAMRRLVERQGGRLVLVDLPQAPSYRKHYRLLSDVYSKTMARVDDSGASYLDFSDLRSIDEDDFFDHTHLLPKGWRKFTQAFVEKITPLLRTRLASEK